MTVTDLDGQLNEWMTEFGKDASVKDIWAVAKNDAGNGITFTAKVAGFVGGSTTGVPTAAEAKALTDAGATVVTEGADFALTSASVNAAMKLNVTSPKAGTAYYLVQESTVEDVPTIEDVKKGKTLAVTANTATATTEALSDLTADTKYIAYVVVVTSDPLTSAVFTTAEFTAADTKSAKPKTAKLSNDNKTLTIELAAAPASGDKLQVYSDKELTTQVGSDTIIADTKTTQTIDLTGNVPTGDVYVTYTATGKEASEWVKSTGFAYAVTITPPTNGTIKVTYGDTKTVVTTGQTIPSGESVSVEATPNDGFVFDTLTVTPNTVKVTTGVFTMPSEAVTIAATFKAAPKSVAKLSNLTLSDGTLDPAFAADKTEYTAEVANNVSSVTVTPTIDTAACGSGATVTVNDTTVTSGSASGSIDLKIGDTTIEVVVTAEDKVTTEAYTITITRKEADSATVKGGESLQFKAGAGGTATLQVELGGSLKFGSPAAANFTLDAAVTSVTVTAVQKVDDTHATLTLTAESTVTAATAVTPTLKIAEAAFAPTAAAPVSATGTISITITAADASDPPVKVELGGTGDKLNKVLTVTLKDAPATGDKIVVYSDAGTTKITEETIAAGDTNKVRTINLTR